MTGCKCNLVRADIYLVALRNLEFYEVYVFFGVAENQVRYSRGRAVFDSGDYRLFVARFKSLFQPLPKEIHWLLRYRIYHL